MARPARSREEESEFFAKYADNYAEPEVIWLSRIIGDALPAGPDSIARAVLAAGYRREQRAS